MGRDTTIQITKNEKTLTLNTDASKRSFPDVKVGLSFFKD
jgi:hypothetical protein